MHVVRHILGQIRSTRRAALRFRAPAVMSVIAISASASLVALQGCSGGGTGPGVIAPTIASVSATPEIPPLPTIAGRDTSTATALAATPVPTPTSTPVPVPTATPTRAATDNIVLLGTGGRVALEGTFSEASSDINTSHFVSTLESRGNAYNLAANSVQLSAVQRTNMYSVRGFSLEFKSPGGFQLGQVLPIADNRNVDFTYGIGPNSRVGMLPTKHWIARAGSLRVTARTGNRISVALQNVRFELLTVSDEILPATSFFTFNGNATLTF